MDKYIEYRREFHKYAEIGWTEIRTSARVAEILTEIGYKEVFLGLEVIEESSIGLPARLTGEQRKQHMERAIIQGANPYFVEATSGYPGVVATFDTGKKGPITAFRFDMDCLPYEEPEVEGYPPFDEQFISVNKNCVHACGHDGHTAIGIGIAEEIRKYKDILCGKIKFIFQPAEESITGAQAIVDKGHLDDVDNLIVMHIALTAEGKPLPSKTIACGCKDFLSDRQIDVYYTGIAAHPCGASQEGKNALLGACSAALNLHCIAPHEEGLCRVNVGRLEAGVCVNTIAPNAMISIEYRGQNATIAEYARKRVFDILDGAAKAYDLSYTYVDFGEVPAGKSDDEMMVIIEDAAKKINWFEKIYFEGNVGGTDDATVMLSKVQANGGKGTYIGIGTNTTSPLHNAKFDFDEECIEASVQLCIKALLQIHKL